MRLTSSWPRGLFGTPALFGLCLLLCLASLGAADLEEDLANMTPDQAYKYAAALAQSGQEDQAIKAYKFIADRYPDHETAPWALFAIGKILFGRTETTEAVAYMQRVLDEYPTSRPVARGDLPFLLVGGLMFRLNDVEGARDVAKSALDNHYGEMRPRYRALIIGRLAEAYIKLGDTAAAEELFTSYLPTCVHLLSHTSYYDIMANVQIARKDFDAALSMARAGYALCDFNETAIKEMANLVRRVFVAKGEFANGTQFLAAQEDPEKPNPLRDVAMPTVTEECKQQLLQAAGQDPALLCHVCLYTGSNDGALDHAMAYMAEASADEAVKALMEVARVFKAADLNLVRANQFIKYAKTGEGENPLAEGTL